MYTLKTKSVRETYQMLSDYLRCMKWMTLYPGRITVQYKHQCFFVNADETKPYHTAFQAIRAAAKRIGGLNKVRYFA